MHSFQDLDTLLETAFDDFQNEEKKPLFISSSEILLALHKKSEKFIEFENLHKLQKRLQLSTLEFNIILILFAPEIDSKYERIYAYIQDNINLNYPTVQLLILLLAKTDDEKQTIYEYFTKSSKLNLLKLIEFPNNNTDELLFKQTLRLAASTRNYLLGDNYLEGTLKEYCQTIEPQQAVKNKNLKLEKYIESGIENSESYFINIYGLGEKNRKKEITKVASYFNHGLLYINTKELMEKEKNLTSTIPYLVRDALLTGTLLYFESFESYLFSEENNESKLFRQLEQLSWLTFFSTTKKWNPKEIRKTVNFYAFETKQNYPFLAHDHWLDAISQFDTQLAIELAPLLSTTFKFSEDEIDNVSQTLHTESRIGKTINKERILRVCRSRISNNLNQFAQHIVSSNDFNDLVLPQEQQEELQNIMTHYKYQNKVFQEWGYEQFFQSRGISLLFSGSSGTGKTMTASVLANTLGLELFKIDLSQMVSKYIGETEKHLSKLFSMAKESGVILFFDEADSIFGKRSEVQDAHDRYANIEVSYLLQKIEEYDGIVILASNFKENIDEAFLRRLRFVIEFPTPDASQRKVLWEKLFPLKLLEESIDFTLLAKHFKLSGANIRNIALYSAFEAAGESSKINMHHIIKALESELKKNGLVYNEKNLEDLKN